VVARAGQVGRAGALTARADATGAYRVAGDPVTAVDRLPQPPRRPGEAGTS